MEEEIDESTAEVAAAVILIVNGRKKPWKERKISFRQVVEMAFDKFEDHPNIEYTVGYSNGPRQNPHGIMVDGDTVFVKTEMNFNVTRTDKS